MMGRASLPPLGVCSADLLQVVAQLGKTGPFPGNCCFSVDCKTFLNPVASESIELVIPPRKLTVRVGMFNNYKKYLLFLILFKFPVVAVADKITHDEFVYGEGSILRQIIFIVLIIVFDIWFINNSIEERKNRYKEGIKIKRDDVYGDIVIPFVGYAIAAFLVSVPVGLVVKFIAGSSAAYGFLFLAVPMAFGLIVYLRQT